MTEEEAEKETANVSLGVGWEVREYRCESPGYVKRGGTEQEEKSRN